MIGAFVMKELKKVRQKAAIMITPFFMDNQKFKQSLRKFLIC